MPHSVTCKRLVGWASIVLYRKFSSGHNSSANALEMLKSVLNTDGLSSDSAELTRCLEYMEANMASILQCAFFSLCRSL